MDGEPGKKQRGRNNDLSPPRRAHERFAPVERPLRASNFPPIGSYAFLSDCHTAALVAPDGGIDWLCIPRFDSASVFGALLDRRAGRFRVGPYRVEVPISRRYIPGTNVMETIWMNSTGWLRVTDALTIGPWQEDPVNRHTRPPTDADAEHVLVRVMECMQGTVEVEMVCQPGFDYNRAEGEWRLVDPTTASATDGTTTIQLDGEIPLGIEGNHVRARHTLAEGEKCFCSLAWGDVSRAPKSTDEAEKRLNQTANFWRAWLSHGSFPDHPWRIHLQRSALVLKGLTYMPTGALVAAPTTSLPETIGGERNWDYRFSWMRDATFALYGLHALGLDWEADDFMQFLADLERNEDGSLQIMYGIDGRRELTEETLDHLRGYEDSQPVRIGNNAYKQRQNDVYGAVLDSVYIHVKKTDYLSERLWPVLRDQAEAAARVWHLADQGIWETRSEPKHYVSSKLMCWVALDRASRLATLHDDPELEQRWRETADEIKADILGRGVSSRGVFRQHYETDALDASLLLMPLVRFLPFDDPRIQATVRAIGDELTEHRLVLRYRPEETDDGLEGTEGTFTICSFWLVSALSEIGEAEEARNLLVHLLALSSELGLYAEEIDAHTGMHLGDFPQAFTHLAMANAIQHVISDEHKRR